MTEDINIFEKTNPEEKYESNKPDILLIDLPEHIYPEIKSKGFNVSEGSFGSPYSVIPGDNWDFVRGEDSLPTISEQDVVIIDLNVNLVDDEDAPNEVPEGVIKVFSSYKNGWIDPRPKSMDNYRYKFDRILNHGGIFVVFAEPIYDYEFYLGKGTPDNYKIENYLPVNNWSFLSIFKQDFTITGDEGKEISLVKNDSPISEFLSKYIKYMDYNCTFQTSQPDLSSCLLKSKFNDCVSFLITTNSDSNGFVLVLPRMQLNSEIILDLLNEVLPELSPDLFPSVKGKWVERDEYKFNSVIEHEIQIDKIIKNAQSEIESIKEDIALENKKLGFLHGIITNTGDELVDDVEKCLEFIGFEKVVNVDNELEKGDDKEEDLRILNGTSLLVEVKGPSSQNKNAYVTQISNYVSRRRKEWGKFNINGVLIINHQRNIPPLERDNIHVFTRNQIKDANRDDIFLITTWELFLFIRGMIQYNWNPKVIRDLFYQTGRCPQVPNNYKPIGKIFTVIKGKNVIGVNIINEELSKGQRIGYRLTDEFLEENVESLEIYNESIKTASVGSEVGIGSKFTDKLREGLTVYKIS